MFLGDVTCMRVLNAGSRNITNSIATPDFLVPPPLWETEECVPANIGIIEVGC